MSQKGSAGKLMGLFATAIMSRLQEGETNWLTAEHHQASEEWDEGIEWFYLSQDDHGEVYTVTEASDVVLQHSMEQIGTYMTDHEKAVFQEFEPQLAVLRQLLRAEAQLAEIAEGIRQNAKLH